MMEPEARREPIPFCDLLARVAHGFSWQDIANEYDVTRDSVKHRMGRLRDRLNVSTAAHAVQRGHTVGWLQKCGDDCELCFRVR